jgi:hypothetical protein
MARIRVNCFIRHMTERGVERSAEEWRSLHIVRVIKGERLNGHFQFPVNGRSKEIYESNRADFLQELYSLTARHIIKNLGREVAIVPIPNSSAVVGDTKVFQTLRLARGVARELGERSAAVSMLRWSSIQEKAHEGGRARDYKAHCNNLTVVRQTNLPIVLFDDVVTTGSQMFASKKMLADNGYDVQSMYAIASVLEHGERSNKYGWEQTSRIIEEQESLF